MTGVVEQAQHDTATQSVYDRGLRLLAELLAREAFIPEPTVASLRRYFPVLCGVLPRGLSEEDWGDRLEYYSDLVARFGRSGAAPRPLRNAVKMWERHECGGAKDMPVPHAPWYQQALAEWARIRDAHRERHARRPKPSLSTPPPEPRLPRVQATDELAKLWAAPDPELTNKGLAVEPEHLLLRLRDPAYAQRYRERLGEAVEPDVPDTPDAGVNRPDEGVLARLATIVQVVGSAGFAAAVARIIAADTAGVLQREPEYPPLPFWALQPAKALQTASART